MIGEVVCPLTGVDVEGMAKQMEMTKEITPRNLKVRREFHLHGYIKGHGHGARDIARIRVGLDAD